LLSITEQQTSVLKGFLSLALCLWVITNLGITLAALAEESWTQASVEAPSQPFVGWMTKSEDLEYLTSTYTDCRHK